TGETRWIDRAADGLMLLCELSTWCWVAHEEAHDRRGWVVPDRDSPVVDLGAARTVQVLAWADLALGGALEERVPGLRARIRREARIRVFAPYLARRDWLGCTAPRTTGPAGSTSTLSRRPSSCSMTRTTGRTATRSSPCRSPSWTATWHPSPPTEGSTRASPTTGTVPAGCSRRSTC